MNKTEDFMVFIFLLFITIYLIFGKDSTIHETNVKNFLDKKSIDLIKVNEKKIDTIHLIRSTRYNAKADQTDSDPLTTADGSKIDLNKLNRGQIRWCALSRDLIWDEERQKIFKDTTHWRGEFEFGDTINVVSQSTPIINGWWVVHDAMKERYKLAMDFLMPVNGFRFGVIKDCKILK